MRPWRQAATGGAAALLLSFQAVAQQPQPHEFSQPNRHKAYVAMGRACSADISRFCPDISPVQLRNIAVCLKPYRSNLSLGCRSSLKSAIGPAQASPGS